MILCKRISVHFKWFYVRGSVYTLNNSLWEDQCTLWMIYVRGSVYTLNNSMWEDQCTLWMIYVRGSVYTLNDSMWEDQCTLWMIYVKGSVYTLIGLIWKVSFILRFKMNKIECERILKYWIYSLNNTQYIEMISCKKTLKD